MTSINILVILGLSSVIKAVPVIDSTDKGEQKRSIASGACLDSLCIAGFTSGLAGADSDQQHCVEIKLTNGDTKTSLLPDLPGDDYLKHKGDLWELSFLNDFNFTCCVKKCDIQSIAIIESNNDGWNIETIFTFIKSGDDSELATKDFDVNRWIDGDGPVNHHRFELNLLL